MAPDPQVPVEHLKLVQGVVTRMAGNSALMKAWGRIPRHSTIRLLSGIGRSPLVDCSGCCIPVIAFWTMDARYLHLERCHIRLYETIVTGSSIAPFGLNYRPYVSTVESSWKIAFSWSVCRFYGSLFAIMLALLVILNN